MLFKHPRSEFQTQTSICHSQLTSCALGDKESCTIDFRVSPSCSYQGFAVPHQDHFIISPK